MGGFIFRIPWRGVDQGIRETSSCGSVTSPAALTKNDASNVSFFRVGEEIEPMLPISAWVYVHTYVCVYKKAYLNMLANTLKIIVIGYTNY